jgi:hypothetical protein
LASGNAVLISLLLFGVLLAGNNAHAAQDTARPEQTRKVLMLFSAAKELPGVVMMEQSVRAELEKRSTNRIDFLPSTLMLRGFPALVSIGCSWITCVKNTPAKILIWSCRSAPGISQWPEIFRGQSFQNNHSSS